MGRSRNITHLRSLSTNAETAATTIFTNAAR